VAADGTTSAAARCTATRIQDRKKRPLTAECSSGWLKKVASCSVTTTGSPVASGIV
jgi:hypothetical protein